MADVTQSLLAAGFVETVFHCPACGIQAHRDVVGQINLLSRHKTGEVGQLPVPATVKYRIPHDVRVLRRCRDTGHLPSASVACGRPQETARR